MPGGQSMFYDPLLATVAVSVDVLVKLSAKNRREFALDLLGN